MTEDLKQQVNLGVANLVEGFQQTPLREFIGCLENYDAERDEQFDRVRVQLQFVGVQVIHSTEAYPFPIAQLTIPYSTRKVSAMGYLVTSIDKLMPGGSLSSLIGKNVRMLMKPENYGRWRGETEDRVRDTWTVVELVGEEAKEAKLSYEVALDLAVGESPSELKGFYQQAFRNPAIKQDKALLTKILDKTFIAEALERGVLEVSEDGLLIRAIQ